MTKYTLTKTKIKMKNNNNSKEQLHNTNSLIITLAAILSVIVTVQLIYVYI